MTSSDVVRKSQVIGYCEVGGMTTGSARANLKKGSPWALMNTSLTNSIYNEYTDIYKKALEKKYLIYLFNFFFLLSKKLSQFRQ